jgi:ribosome-associated protein
MDWGDVVAHVFRSDVRAHYNLEKLWADAKRVPVPPPTQPAFTTPMHMPIKRPRRVRKQG